VVLAGVAGLTVTTLLFGLSKSFVSVILTRALGLLSRSESVAFYLSRLSFSAGLASGNVTVIPTILIEITDKTNQSFAFPFFGFWWPVGSIIG